MKYIITLLLISFCIGVVNGQIQDQKVQPVNVEKPDALDELLKHPEYDSLQAERFFNDSLGNKYMVEYRYTGFVYDGNQSDGKGHIIKEVHNHAIAICKIISYKGNRQKTVASGIKAIYSPVECSSDNTKLWLQRFYKAQANAKH